MSSRPLVILGIIIILIAVIAAAGFVMNGRGAPYQAGIPVTDQSTNASSTDTANISPSFYQSTSTPDSSTSAGGSGSSPGAASIVRPNANGSISLTGIPFPASSTVSTASWIIYVDNADGYSYEHPSNMTQGSQGGSVAFTFPKNSYFHWPLLDDAKMSVLVGPSCPSVIEGAFGQGPVKFTLNGRDFTRVIGTDVGAGQLYTEIAYDTKAGGQCYHIDFLDHATNGAGFYVDDASLIAKYDAQHAVDLAAAISVFNGVVNSFRVLAPAR